MAKKQSKKVVDPNSIKLDGHDFNKTYVKSFKTEKDFLDVANDIYPKPKGDAKAIESNHKEVWFPNDPNREVKLKQVYALATAKEEAPASPAAQA